MAAMRAPRSALGTVCLLVCGSLLVAGCGGGSGSSSHVNPEAETGKSRAAPAKSAFPSPHGATLREFISEVATHAEVKVTPEAQAFYPGPNRYPFSVTEKIASSGKAGKEIADAEAAIYYAKVRSPKPGARSKARNKRADDKKGGATGAGAKTQSKALEEPAIGPFPARIETLATKPSFQGRTTTEEPDVATVVYSVELNLPEGGEYRPAALVKEKGGLGAKLLPSIKVDEYAKIPRPGDKAPLIETPTAKSVGGDLAKLTTRIPPDTQNKVNYAEVLGKEPILLLFATPKFCQSRVCGPVVDVAQQAQHQFEGKANFIHMEIYNHNDPSQGVRPQVRRFHLPTEPWLFAINREGVVSAAIEGAFGTQLMDKTVEKVVGE
jgi:hypothetical protein